MHTRCKPLLTRAHLPILLGLLATTLLASTFGVIDARADATAQ